MSVSNLNVNRVYSILEHLSEALVCFDSNWKFTYINETACKLLGVNHCDLIDQCIDGVISNDIKSVFAQNLHERLSDETSVYYETYFEPSSAWLRVRVHTLGESEFCCYIDDISHLMKVERESNLHPKGEIEKRFIELHNRFSVILEHSTDIFSLTRPDGVCEYISPAAQSQLGYRPLELIGGRTDELCHPEDIMSLGELIERAIKGEKVDRYMYRIRHKDGHYVWFETDVALVRGDDGEIVYILGVGRNITDRRQVEDGLRLSQNKLIRAQAMAHMGDWDFSLLTNRSHLSDELYRIFGLTPGEYISEPQALFQFLHPEDRAYVKAQFQAAVRGIPFEMDYRIIRRDGTCRTIHSIGGADFDGESGRPIRVYGTAQDITERKQTELQLRESEERYRVLVENALNAVAVSDGETWIYMNQAGMQMFGAQDETEILGKPIQQFLHPNSHAICIQQLNQTIQENCCTGTFEQTWRALDGRIVETQVLALPVIFEHQRAAQLVIYDVSNQKHTENLLIQSEKLSAVGQLAAGIAHEIRNPLTALKGFLQLLSSDNDNRNQKYFDIMLDELGRIEMIASELLMLAKPQANMLKMQQVQTSMERVLEVMETQAVLNNVVIIREFMVCSSIRYEENQMKQVFLNLVKNAIEAMPSGGCITVRIEERDKYVVIAFKDEGHGISPEILPRLGQPFFTTKQSGTGLGLMVTRKIVQNHNGLLEFYSEANMGTTVMVKLPLNM